MGILNRPECHDSTARHRGRDPDFAFLRSGQYKNVTLWKEHR